MKIYVIQSKNGIMMNAGVSVVWFFVKKFIRGILEYVIVSAKKHVKLVSI